MNKIIRDFLQCEIDQRVTPGAIVRVTYEGNVVLEEAVGHLTDAVNSPKVTTNTLYDMASLTKVMVTMPLIMQLAAEGVLHLKDRVIHWVPEFGVNGKELVTIQQLLTHSSGLIAHRPYFEQRLNREEILLSIYQEELTYTPDTQVIYSDLGFIVLLEVIERVTGQSIRTLAKDRIFTPLAMRDTDYLPDSNRYDIAPTEYYDHLNGHKIGIVHDDNTEFMGGISSHAGLFSTMEDLALFITMLENNGKGNGRQIIPPSFLSLATQNLTPYANEARGLGFQLQSSGTGPTGDLFSTETYGHTGYTGTSFYIDPIRKLTITLLTNRVYYGRHDPILRLRPRLHNLLISQLEHQ